MRIIILPGKNIMIAALSNSMPHGRLGAGACISILPTACGLVLLFNLLVALSALALDPPSFSTTGSIALQNGSFARQVPVTMTAPGATDIYFSTNGKEPDTGSQHYTSPVTISSPTLLKAVAWNSGTSTYSAVQSIYLDVDPSFVILRQRNDTVRFTLSGTITAGDVVTIAVYDDEIPAAGSLPQGQRKYSHTVISTDTYSLIAADLKSQMAADSALGPTYANLQINHTTGDPFLTVGSTRLGNSTWYSQYVSAGATLVVTRAGALTLRFRAPFGVLAGNGPSFPITKWIDLSGCGNDATSVSGHEPTLTYQNGLQCVKFDGASTQYLSLPSGFEYFRQGLSFFLVVAPASSITASKRFFDLGTGATTDSIYVAENTPDGMGLVIYDNTSSSVVSNTNTLTAGRFQIIEGNVGGSTTVGTLFVNGVQNGSTSVNLPRNVVRSTNYIGRSSAGTENYTGAIAELLLYSTQLTAEQRTNVEEFLIRKYQALSMVPANPTISPPAGTLSAPAQVVISAPEGATIFFTTNNTDPSTTSQIYRLPITVNYTQTVKAMCVKNGIQSGVSAAAYTLDSNIWPVLDPGDTTAPTINLQLPVQSQ